jgi:probable phosphoglycerate mutase
MTDAKGQVLAELSGFLGAKTNNVAEYSGLLACLEWALDQGHPYLRVVSDSELMVKQIQGKYKVKSPDLRPLFDEANRRIALLRGFEISHALRHKNKDADRLANEAMDRGMGKRPAAAPSTSNASTPASGTSVLRGFTRDGTIHLLGGASLPEGVFVKIIPE